MKYIIYAINLFLFLMIPTVLFVFPVTNKVCQLEVKTKKLNSSVISNVEVVAFKEILPTEEKEETVNEENIEKQEKTVEEKKANIEKSIDVINPVEEKPLENNKPVGSDILETQVGAMSAYGPDCFGCSGKVGSGYDVRGGNIYYTDATYGKVRIVAGDKKYPYGTIVRVTNSKLGEPFYAIVLDRGGNIGLEKRFLFDLLFSAESEALLFGTNYNVVFEVVRYGY